MADLWFLAVLVACPLMMFFMMRGMHGGGHQASPRVDQRSADRRDRRIAELEQQVAGLQGSRPDNDRTSAGGTDSRADR